MERILKNTTATASAVFEVDGVATNPTPDTATVTITRADGTTLVASTPATNGADPGEFTFPLTTTHTGLLDTLTLTWVSALGTITTTVEVVGGFLFSIQQARALKPLDNATTYTTARILEARTLAEQTIEDACGRAFVPRYRSETIDGTGTGQVMLTRPDLRVIRTVTLDDTAYTSPQIEGLALRPSGILHNTLSSWTSGYGNLTVGYEHGTDLPPARVSQAALILARSWLVSGPVDNRALGQASPDGSFSFGLATPGRNGSYVGIPEVDATIDAYSMRTGVA